MTKRLITIFIVVTILGLLTPPSTDALSLNFIKKVVDVFKTSYKYYTVAQDYAKLAGYVPHTFPFGGHITSSELACSLKFSQWYGACYPIIGCWLTGPIPGYIPLPGRAIEVGPPIPTNGKVIDFPFISEIYRNKQEDRVGPWALGLGFTPFPLDQINKSLSAISLPNPLVGCFYRPAALGDFCYDNFHIDCSASGEKDKEGNDIYKVILKLGTSPD